MTRRSESKAKGKTTRRRKPSSYRPIDELVQSGRLDPAWLVALESAHDSLTEQWSQSEATLDNVEVRGLLSLLGAMFAPARLESAKALERSGNIALDLWYRVEWLRQVEKAAIYDVCRDWSLGRTQIVEAKARGWEHAKQIGPAMTGKYQQGERLPNVEEFLEKLRKGRKRVRLSRGR